MKQVNIGIVGTKFISQLHMISYAKLNPSKFRIHGVTSGNPENARKSGIKGDVILQVTIDKEGRVKSVQVVKSIPTLDKSAIDAVRQWVYEPYIVEGKPRIVIVTVKVSFRLD